MDGLLVNRIDFFAEMMKSGSRLDVWNMDPELHLLKSTCDKAEDLHNIFSAGECFQFLLEYISIRGDKPLMLSNSLGMNWIATLDIKADNVCSVYMIGPSFAAEKSTASIRRYLNSKSYPSVLVDLLMQEISNVPVVALTTMHQFGTMLHYAVTGNNVQFNEFNYQSSGFSGVMHYETESTPTPKNQTWYFEQRAMDLIENGCPDYKDTLGRLSEAGGAYISLAGGNYIRGIKNSILSFITISTRAAIRGGLDPEIAYTIGQRYADSAELSESVSELVNINSRMYDDFVQRVHRVKESSGVSNAISACQAYIELHITEKISLNELAGRFNYSESRFSQKFKEETGKSISRYIKERRIERAKLLLESSRKSVQEIADELGFCNASYFVETFRSVVGITPGEYMEKK